LSLVSIEHTKNPPPARHIEASRHLLNPSGREAYKHKIAIHLPDELAALNACHEDAVGHKEAKR